MDRLEAKIDAVLFLDANVKSISECQLSRCQKKAHIFCKHRFLFNFRWFREAGPVRMARLFDHQVVLYCLGLIYKYRWVGSLAQKGRFFLVTCDHNFIRDAEIEWKKRAKRDTWPKLNFNKSQVVIGKFIITVKTVPCQKNGAYGHLDLMQVVEELNSLFAGQ